MERRATCSDVGKIRRDTRGMKDQIFTRLGVLTFLWGMIFAGVVGWVSTSWALEQKTSFFGLAPDAQAAIAGSLGRDNPAYHVERTSGGLLMKNEAHGLSVFLGKDGARFQAQGVGSWGLRLESIGYGNARIPLAAFLPMGDVNGVEYRRDNCTEWYVNSPLGIEQGFTIHEPPRMGAGHLTIAMSVSGDLDGRFEAGRIIVRDAQGREVFQYAGLAAWDATGRPLHAWMEQRRESLHLVVDDREARYPLTIDPWVQQAKLTASEKDVFDLFGYSVAASGDTLVVGAVRADPEGVVDAGAAYVFVKPAGGWSGNPTESAKLTASDKAASDLFGFSVAVSGDTVVIGRFDAGGVGAAYVFVKPVGGWSGNLAESAKLTGSDVAVGSHFGASVALSGSSVVVGAEYADPDSKANAGAAYVFEKPPGGWSGHLTESARLTASDKAMSDNLGRSVALSGDTVVAGAPGAGSSDTGAAYVFVKPAGGWSGNLTQSARLSASDISTWAAFGSSVAVSGDSVVVGAPQADPDWCSDAGAAYVFVKP